jgi:hypothetical protein
MIIKNNSIENHIENQNFLPDIEIKPGTVGKVNVPLDNRRYNFYGYKVVNDKKVFCVGEDVEVRI